jgi:predicted type IV restriction endonuclease
MSLQEAIDSIRLRLARGEYQTEAAVSQGVVRRLLSELGWDTFDPDLVSPEYSLKGGRVDFALCYPRQKPYVFIEVKQEKTSLGGDEQLFRYAFAEGVPIAVLTNGREWHFYLPSGQGSMDERRFYLLDVAARDSAESANRFTAYLSFEAVKSDKARERAFKDYSTHRQGKEVEKSLPAAFRDLLSEADDLLVDLLTEKVAETTGFAPERDTVIRFLVGQAERVVAGPERPHPAPTPPIEPAQPKTPNRIGYEVNGVWRDCRSGKDVMIGVLRHLADADPTFLPRFAAIKHGKKRRWVAEARADLYPGRPDLEHLSEELRPGWWVGTNYSAEYNMPKIVSAACDVAGVKFGSAIRASFR